MPAVEGAVIGNARVEINTGTIAIPVWSKIKDEVKFELSRTNTIVERKNKDTGSHVSKVKTFIDTKISVTAQENALPGAGYIGWGDIYIMTTKTYADVGRGEYQVRILPTESGLSSIAATALITNITYPMQVGEIVEYSFEIDIISLPTVAEVA